MTVFNADGSHPRERETYEHIATWANTRFPFSQKDQWERFGILGVIGDIVLLAEQNTHILEIGTGESSIYLTELARRHNRKIFYCDYAYGKIVNPMTVKGYLHEDTILIEENKEYSSDIYNHQAIAFRGTSDNFFKQLALPYIGLAFIDGEHHYEYVKRDFENVLNLLVPNGYVFLHDTYPPDESYVLNDYCADSYKIRQELEKDPRVDVFTFNRIVACNVGLTMVRKKPIERAYYHE